MKTINVLGPGCQRGEAVEGMVKREISDYARIAGYAIAPGPQIVWKNNLKRWLQA